jgi:beta-N-acetylhexosaminidase
MDLRKQIGSLFMTGFAGTTLSSDAQICRDIVQHGLGGVILFSRRLNSRSLEANISSPEQLRALTAALQQTAEPTLLIGIDQEGGAVQRLRRERGFSQICSAQEMGASGGDTEATRTQARTNADMLARLGINLNFAPVVDVNVNPDNPVIGILGRSFSDDPALVAAHARAWIEEHNRWGIISCLKHFPGHGSSTNDSHLGFVDISTSWQEPELFAYRDLIDDNLVDLVMTGHLFNQNIDPHYPATLSKKTIAGLLRAELGYRGPVISDDMQMRAITDHYDFSEAVCRALDAGVDIIVFGNNLDYDPDICSRGVQAVLDGLDRGVISEERLHSAFSRVQCLKQRAGEMR